MRDSDPESRASSALELGPASLLTQQDIEYLKTVPMVEQWDDAPWAVDTGKKLVVPYHRFESDVAACGCAGMARDLRWKEDSDF